MSRTNSKEDSHIQFNPTGIYLGEGDNVTLLRYATVSSVMQDITKEVSDMPEKAAQSAPQEKAPSQAEIKQAVDQLALLTYAAAVQEQQDAATLNAAAAEFASKFKPEYILDEKEVWGGKEITLRSEAYASALAEAVDSLMTNPALAELVDRRAALKGLDRQKKMEFSLEFFRCFVYDSFHSCARCQAPRRARHADVNTLSGKVYTWKRYSSSARGRPA